MNDIDTARLAYLAVLGGAVVIWFVAQNRMSLNKTLQSAAIWVLIFLGAIAAVGLWEDIRGTALPSQISYASEGRVEVPRAHDGHYYLTLKVNGADTRFVVDTGATDIVLKHEDAIAAGIDPAALQYFGRAMTANGEVSTAPIRLDSVAIGDIVDTDVTAFVTTGDMSQSLLGMAYLQRWGRLEIAGGKLVLTR